MAQLAQIQQNSRSLISSETSEKLLLSLTKEIAMDILPLQDILKLNHVTPQQFSQIVRTPRYKTLMQQARLEWSTAKNSAERVRLKTAVMLEEALPEFHARMHDKSEPLSSKVELAKFVGKLSGIGEKAPNSGPAAETFKVIINLGESEKLSFEKELPAKVIEAEAE
jgi:hypothetical protein